MFKNKLMLLQSLFKSKFLFFYILFCILQLNLNGEEKTKEEVKSQIVDMIHQATSSSKTPTLEALEQVKAARILAIKNQEDSLACFATYLLSTGYDTRGMVDSSYKFYNLFFKKCADNYPNMMIRAKVNLSRSYCYTGNFEKAREALEDISALVQEQNSSRLSFSYHYGYAVFYHLTEEYDSMKIEAFKALNYALEAGNYGVATDVYSTIGVAFSELEQYDSSLYYNTLAYSRAKERLDTSRIMNTALNVGALYRDVENYDSALYYLNTAEEISHKLGNTDLMRVSAEFISATYELMGDSESALKKFKEFRDLEREYLGESHVSALNEMEVKYETARKDNEIQQLTAQKEIEEAQRKVLIIILAFLLILSVAAVYLIRIRNKTNRKLKEIDRNRVKFFSNISHELKTPLTLIKGPVSTILEKQKSQLDEETLQQLKLVEKNSDQLSELITQLLDIARSEEGQLEVNKQSFDLQDVFEPLKLKFENWAFQKKIKFQWIGTEKSVSLYSDKSLVEKMLSNLISNAIKFTPESGEILISQEIKDGRLFIEVEDSGEGIKEADKALIFDRFYQADNQQGNKGGTGIGLSIVKEFSKLLGAEVKLSRSKLGGAKFSITFPIGSAELAPKQEARLNQEVQTEVKIKQLPENKEEWPLVLVVDDHADIRTFIAETLKNEYRIIEAADGEEAFRKAKEELPDVILSDIMMPKVDGLELLSKVRNDKEIDYLAFLLLTARGSEAIRIDSWKDGADAYLTKPFNSKELRYRLQSLLDNRNRLKNKLQAASAEAKASDVSKSEFEQKFEALIQENYQNPEFSFNDVLDEFAMSRSTFQRKVKSAFDQSPQSLLVNKRLEMAKALLQQGENNVAEVAYACGFNSISYFSRSFKQAYGANPVKLKTA
tara:strand:- start:3709 stop:6390 length:2682 start_codon:yes stop_codon:yes gene_type:complete